MYLKELKSFLIGQTRSLGFDSILKKGQFFS
jgi:hypothetical protein